MSKHKKDVVVPKKRYSWERTNEWHRTVDRVFAAKDRGQTEAQMAVKLRLDKSLVKRILEDDAIADERARRQFDEKMPTMQNIISLSLKTLNRSLQEISESDEMRSLMVRNMKDLVALKDLVKDLQTLTRLELGQSTQNIEQHVHAHTYQETREIIQDLQKKDPVFTYPELPAPPEDKEGDVGQN